MTEKENTFRRRRIKGLGLSLLGFLVASVIPVTLDYVFGFAYSIWVVIIGYGIILFGFAVYLHAFLGGMRYARSEEYKRDLIAQQPWEQ